MKTFSRTHPNLIQFEMPLTDWRISRWSPTIPCFAIAAAIHVHIPASLPFFEILPQPDCLFARIMLY